MVHRSIELITDKAKLIGTGYFELMPGAYENECWKHGSVFLDEEVFALLEPAIQRHAQGYDHYAFTPVRKDAWKGIISELNGTKERLAEIPADAVDTVLGMMFATTKGRFIAEFEQNRAKTIEMIRDLIGWLEETLKTHDLITILGM
ncbi:MAG: hypothetical protein JXQ73_23605 [Phycisphaerae bacterium]|nr:hypothetical protein [Phycisphaerae bacterium]